MDVDFAAVDRVSPENGARHLRSASSHQPGEAEDFAFAEGEADVLDRRAAIEADHAQHLLAAAPTFGPRDVAEFASDHQRDDPGHRRAGGGKRFDGLAVAHHRHAVGDALHLVHLVGDVDDADAMGLQVLDDGEQMFDLGLIERRRGLVHHQHFRVEREGLGDLDKLLARDREVADFSGRIDRHLHPLEQRGGGGVLLRLVDEHAETAARLAADEDVLGGRHVVHQEQFLMNDADAQFLRGARSRNRDGLALDDDLASVGLDDAGEHLHQRRLAGAVLSHQGVDFAGAQVEARAAKRLHAWERLLDQTQFDQHRLVVAGGVLSGLGCAAAYAWVCHLALIPPWLVLLSARGFRE